MSNGQGQTMDPIGDEMAIDDLGRTAPWRRVPGTLPTGASRVDLDVALVRALGLADKLGLHLSYQLLAASLYGAADAASEGMAKTPIQDGRFARTGVAISAKCAASLPESGEDRSIRSEELSGRHWGAHALRSCAPPSADQ